MAQTFQIFKVPDRQLLASLSAIAEDCGCLGDAEAQLLLTQKHKKPIDVKLSQFLEDETCQRILGADSAVFESIRATFPSFNRTNIYVVRESFSDKATVNFSDDMDAAQAATLLSAAHKHLQAYARTESTDKLLGDELAEFYRRREQSLLRLEDITQDQIKRNKEFSTRLDEEFLKRKNELATEHEQAKVALEADFEARNQELKVKEESLQARAQDLDDRDSRHARRQLRQDLKRVLEQSGQDFSLTRKTSRKRFLIHLLFAALIFVTGGVFLYSAISSDYLASDSGAEFWYSVVRLMISGAGLAAAIVFYIRWQDHWFRQHADEEFRLKRLALDIDRASWVVEMALEWQEEKESGLPPELVDRLTANLFVDNGGSSSPTHPSEDLASGLLAAASGLTLRIPGVGEAALDRRGVKRFKGAVERVSDEGT